MLFQTEVDIDVIAVEHLSEERWSANDGERWGDSVFCRNPGCPIRDIALASNHSPNLFVFLTGEASRGGLGIAYVGTACLRSLRYKNYKTSLTKYRFNDEYTAEIITHEIGHNLGIFSFNSL